MEDDVCRCITAGSIGDPVSSRLAWPKVLGVEGTITPKVFREAGLSSVGVSLTVLEEDDVVTAPSSLSMLVMAMGGEIGEVEKSVVSFRKILRFKMNID